MSETDRLSTKIKLYLKLVIPLMLTETGLFAMNLVDTMMTGHIGPTHLAGVAIGSSFWVVIDGIIGLLMAVTPLIAKYVGQNRKQDIPHIITHAIYIALVIGIAVILAECFMLESILQHMNLEEDVLYVTKYYVIALSSGLIPLMIFSVFTYFANAIGKTSISMIMTVIALCFNIGLNDMFIFGHFGAPKLGGIGAGVASSITYWLLMILSIVAFKRMKGFREYQLKKKDWRLQKKTIFGLFTLGLPLCFSLLLDTGADSAITFLMGMEYDKYILSANQIAGNFHVLLFMVPVSIASATTTLVAFELGAKRKRDAMQYVGLSFVFSIGYALVMFALVNANRTWISSLYTDHSAVIEKAATLLFWSMVLLCIECIKLPTQGTLRGMQDVNFSTFFDMTGFWLIGISLGYALSQMTSLDYIGFAVGQVVGITVATVLNVARLVYLYKSSKEKVEPSYSLKEVVS